MIGVRTANDIRYSALSMGAGEQRAFKLLKTAYSVPAFSLILIDEIDLLLHIKALERLIKKLAEIAEQRKLQIVFTTHSLAMRGLTDYTDIRYLFQTPEKTMVFDSITPDIVYDLTDATERSLTVYVEDDLAKAVVLSVASGLGLSRHTDIRTVGSCENAFTLAAGLVLQGAPLSDRLIVLDGDVYRSDAEKKDQMLRKLSGTEKTHDRRVDEALSLITQLCLPENTCPEKYIRDMIVENSVPGDKTDEIGYCARQITSPKDSHDWLNGIVERLDFDKHTALFKIIENASAHKAWNGYVANVYNWLNGKKRELKL